jgi:hypothetical protein
VNVFHQFPHRVWVGIGVVCDNVLRNMPAIDVVVKASGYLRPSNRDLLDIASSFRSRWN